MEEIELKTWKDGTLYNLYLNHEVYRNGAKWVVAFALQEKFTEEDIKVVRNQATEIHEAKRMEVYYGLV